MLMFSFYLIPLFACPFSGFRLGNCAGAGSFLGTGPVGRGVPWAPSPPAGPGGPRIDRLTRSPRLVLSFLSQHLSFLFPSFSWRVVLMYTLAAFPADGSPLVCPGCPSSPAHNINSSVCLGCGMDALPVLISASGVRGKTFSCDTWIRFSFSVQGKRMASKVF